MRDFSTLSVNKQARHFGSATRLVAAVAPATTRLACGHTWGLRKAGSGALAVMLALGLAVSTQQVRAAEEAAFEIVARDGRLFPEVLNVPAGVKIRLTLRNEGKVAVEFENLELRVEKILGPNSASRVVLQPLKPGTYVFIDEFQAETGKMQLIAK